MQINLDYDLAKPLASALKVKAPYIGIPMPGHAPLTFDRKKLSACLKGVKPTNIEVLTSDEMEDAQGSSRHNLQKVGHTSIRWMRVEGYASNGRVRTRLTIRAIPASFWKSAEGKQALRAWRDAESREHNKLVLSPKSPAERKSAAVLKKAETTLKRLSKELDRMGSPMYFPNPAVPRLRSVANEYTRERTAEYLKTKRTRTLIGAIAAQAKRDQWSSVQLYKHLAARGYTFDKLSDMTAKERERLGADDFRKYLTNLHRFVHGSGLWHDRDFNTWHGVAEKSSDRQTWGGQRFMEKLADIQMRRSLQNQMDSVREIMAQNGAGPLPAPELVHPQDSYTQEAIAA